MRVRVVGVCGLVAALAASLLAGCGGGNDLPVSCGHGAHVAAGQCVADVSCGAGTTLVDGGCVASSQCGPGTAMVNGRCVSTESCGPGTQEVNGSCVPLDGGAPSGCGAGTHLTGGARVPNPGHPVVHGRLPDVVHRDVRAPVRGRRRCPPRLRPLRPVAPPAGPPPIRPTITASPSSTEIIVSGVRSSSSGSARMIRGTSAVITGSPQETLPRAQRSTFLRAP
jgi:hypothetical protein